MVAAVAAAVAETGTGGAEAVANGSKRACAAGVVGTAGAAAKGSNPNSVLLFDALTGAVVPKGSNEEFVGAVAKGSDPNKSPVGRDCGGDDEEVDAPGAAVLAILMLTLNLPVDSRPLAATDAAVTDLNL